MAKGRVRQVLLTVFRVIQFILSIIALVCGIYITYIYYNMAESAQAIEEVIDGLDQENDGVQILQHSLVPVLHHLEGNPMRAIIIFVAALWSTLSIVYLFFTNRAARKSYRDLKRNSRTTRILLSLLTLILWIAAIVCSALLVVEFGVFTITVGPETKTAFTILKAVIMEALQQAAKSNKTISNALNIVSTIISIGAMAIVLLGSSIICCKVALVDCLIACCTSGKTQSQQAMQTQVTSLEKGGHQIVVTSA